MNPLRQHPDIDAPFDTGAWVEIDQSVIAANLEAVIDAITDHRLLCAVVKGDAYGHGLENVLPLLQDSLVGTVGIAENREARQVRQFGFSGRILRVRTAAPEEVRAAVGLGVEEMVGGIENAAALSAVAAKAGVVLPVHLVLNSAGLCRDGLDLAGENGRRSSVQLLGLPHLAPMGVVTHFATEDVEDTQKMLRRFLDEAAWLQSLRPDRRFERHCASSFAALMVPETRLDMVRVGGALYGETGATVPSLRRAMALKSRITALNDYPAGSDVGYDRSHRLTEPARLASVPLGYANGYRRAFDDRGEALVHGRRARVMGHVSMNTLILDVTGIDDIAPGDEVVFFGRQGHDEITAGDVERSSGTPVIDLFAVWGSVNARHAI